MSDIIDDANDCAEKWLAAHIEEHQYQTNLASIVFGYGRCRNCDKALDDGRSYCDRDCAADFEKRQRASKRNGFRAVL